MSNSNDDTSVRVALRIRPLIPREIIDGSQTCTSVSSDQPQVWIGATHAFTFDYVFDTDTHQESVFQSVQGLVDGCLDGYNATIIAYGQTGSGKTYTMGTGFDVENLDSPTILDTQGIIPRAVHYLFDQIEIRRHAAIEKKQSPPEFSIRAQFVELYNEEIKDLIDSQGAKKGSSHIKIQEDPSGSIMLIGVGSKRVQSAPETLFCLRNGALSRTTAATNMNDQSSRSHAIFTLHIEQQRLITEIEMNGHSENDRETLVAKFHFVDLAGSERLKRTGAVGDRAKEGISINCGLLALGNVISALGDKSKKATHVPYRDSKLTRLLQDSLGGNSRTIMIACVSPSDRDFVETLNTLKYANRTRNIKNKVTVNQDKSSRTIALLRQEIYQLQLELFEYKQGKRAVTADGEEVETDAYQENLLLKSELETLRSRVKALQETVERLNSSNADLITEKAAGIWVNGSEENHELADMIRKYVLDIEDLRSKLFESEATCENLVRKNLQSQTILNQSLSPRAIVSMSSRPRTAPVEMDNETESESTASLLDAAKSELIRERKKVKKLRHNSKKKRRNESSHSHDEEEVLIGENNLESSSSIDESDEEPTSETECSVGTQEDIAQLNDQINFKEKLIAQLEVSNRRVLETKSMYEDKIKCLTVKIKKTEEERDTFMNMQLSKNSTNQQTKAKEASIKESDAKLLKLQQELKEMNKAVKEHDKLVRKNAANEKQVAKLKSEIEDMKRIKVKLMNQLKEDGIKWREAETKRLREIAQLKKDQRKKEVQIRSLESKGKLNEQLLKRKHEEVNMLRKQSKNNLSRKAAGRVPVKKTSPVKAKKKWNQIHSDMLKQAAQKATLEALETEMMSAISERTKIKDEIHNLNTSKCNPEITSDEMNLINDDLDAFKVKLSYYEEKINEIQSSIMELTASGVKDDENGPDMQNFAEALNKEECGYIMQKMYEDSLDNLTSSKQISQRFAVLEEQNIALTRQVTTLDNLLHHVLSKCADPDWKQDIPSLIAQLRLGSEGLSNFQEDQRISSNGLTNGLKANVNTEHDFDFPKPLISRPPVSVSASMKKARRLTSTTQELLGSIPPEKKQDGAPGTPQPQSFVRTSSLRVPNSKVVRRNTYLVSAEDPLPRSATDSQNNRTNGTAISTNNFGVRGRTYTKSRPTTAGSYSNNNNTSASKDITEELNTTFMVASSTTPPGSPNASRKVRDGSNVFNRLTSGTGNTVELANQIGSIRLLREKTASYKSVLQHTHSAEGHSKPVLSVYATDDRLVTGSKDATAKYWDLNCGQEISTFSGHPTSVTGVQFDAGSGLVFTTSSYYIKVYDPRANKCVRTMISSGGRYNEDLNVEPNSRVVSIPNGEFSINSLVISVRSNSFYSTFNDRVRVWDIRNFSSVGLMTGKHQSQVMCMALNQSSGTETLVTGSKDHTIKVYDLGTEPIINTNTPVKFTLDPPHYDGIEALALSDSILFSGSRDNCIKKWNVAAGELQFPMNNAHNSWITGLCFAPSGDDHILSASRDGLVKMWTTEQCREIGRAEIHKGGVNCITSNSSLVFTGSSEDSVGIWKIRRLLGEPLSGDTSPTSDTS